MRDRRLYAVAVLATGAYLALAIANARTWMPWCDEAWFADAALNLLTRGAIANTVLDPTAGFRGVRLDGIHEHAYWIMPLHVVALAAWTKLAGFGLFTVRALSVLWGLLALGAWCAIVRKLSGQAVYAAAALAAIAIDFQFVWTGSVGRMDMMSAALGSCGVAAYLWLRDRSYTKALLAGNALVSAAIFTHPNAVIFFADLCFLALCLDRRQVLRIRTLALAASPYLAGLAGWGMYIAHDPHLFATQFLGNAGNAQDRFGMFAHPLETLTQEVSMRYLQVYGAYSQGFSRTKLVVLAAYAAAACAFGLLRKFRGERGWRLLGGIITIHAVLLCFLDGFKSGLYMIYVVPPLAAIYGVVIAHAWMEHRRLRPAVAAVAAAVCAIQIGVTAARVRQNGYGRQTVPAVQFLETHARPPQTIMASSEFGFFLGFTPRLIDDYRLGYRSGKRPDFIVMDDFRYVEWNEALRNREPATYRYVRDLLSNRYKLVYTGPAYKIYERQPGP